jgi:hypothetical protein
VICASEAKGGEGTGESDLRRRRCAVVDLAGDDLGRQTSALQIKPGPFAAASALFPFNCPCLPLILKQLYWALFFIGNALLGVDCYTCLSRMSLSLSQMTVTVTRSHVNPPIDQHEGASCQPRACLLLSPELSMHAARE